MIVLFNYVTGRMKLDKDDFMILSTRRTRGRKKNTEVKIRHKDERKEPREGK